METGRFAYRGRFGVLAGLKRWLTRPTAPEPVADPPPVAPATARPRRDTSTVAFDEAWYLGAYPQAAADIARGRAVNAWDHYDAVGRFRGYLPNASAPRPRNPAAVRSEFGGLWTDQRNALDLVDGKLELGVIDAAQAALLRAFIVDGYVVLRNAVPERILSRAARALDDAYDGKLPDLQFACPDLGYEVGPWDPRVRDLPAKALEIHAESADIRDAIFSSKVVDFLNLVFERPPLASQSLGFYRGSGQNLHQDTAYVTYSLPLQFVASWVALEDVQAGAGELMYRRGSQALAEYLYDGEFKSLLEAQRACGDVRPELLAQEGEHSQSLAPRSDQADHVEQTFLARRGDVLIWAADLAHGGKPISLQRTRKSVVTHYCPVDVAPLYFENRTPRTIVRHKSGARYTTFLDPPPAQTSAKTGGPRTARALATSPPTGVVDRAGGDLAFAKALLASGFDDDAYRAANADLAALERLEAALHYHRFGRRERRRAYVSLSLPQALAQAVSCALPEPDDRQLREDLVAAALGRLDPFGDDPQGLRDLMAVDDRYRRFVVVGDSHGHFYLNEQVLRSAGLLPIPYLCTGASARGLSNPHARAGYGPRIVDFLDQHADQVAGMTVFLKFGQVDLEFVHDFRRIRDGRRAYDAAEAEAFAADSARRYAAFVAKVQGLTRAHLVVTSAFPPALNDEALREGYLDGHIAGLHAEGERTDLVAALADLEMPGLTARTHLARSFNAALAAECAAAGLTFCDDFTPLLGPDGLLDPQYVDPHGGTDHHMAFAGWACGDAAARLARRICAA